MAEAKRVRLTAAQAKFLERLAVNGERGVPCVSDYVPMLALIRNGLASWSGRRSHGYAVITEAGKVHLKTTQGAQADAGIDDRK